VTAERNELFTPSSAATASSSSISHSYTPSGSTSSSRLAPRPPNSYTSDATSINMASGGSGGGGQSSSFNNNQNYGYDSRTNHALKEHDFFSSTSSTLDAYLAQGQAVLGNLTTQREVMKGTKKRLLNAANTLGLSRETITFIERRTKADWYILVGGGTVTLVCFGLILKYFG